MASIVGETLFYYRDGGSYLVHRHVLMPDHLHVILTPGDNTSLERAVQLIKGGSSHAIGKARGMHFPVWHEGFTEHQIRDQNDYATHCRYIDDNPIKARLAPTATGYAHGSAVGKFKLDPWPLASGAKALVAPVAFSAGLKPRLSVPADSAPNEIQNAEAN